MKAIFVPICLGFAVFFGLPMANEGSINPCGAYDALAVRIGAPIVGNKGQQQNDLLNGKKFGDLLNGAMNGQPQAIKIAPPRPAGRHHDRPQLHDQILEGDDRHRLGELTRAPLPGPGAAS